jgi:hypothetical protein
MHPIDYFYALVQYLFGSGAVSDSGNQFRPYTQTTQLLLRVATRLMGLLQHVTNSLQQA